MSSKHRVEPLEKLETGIPGFDYIARGGMPRGRSTLVSGTSGSGKTVLASQFLAAGIARGEPGVFVTFEEEPEALRRNLLGFGWDVAAWEEAGHWAFVDAAPVPEQETVVAGDYDLAALVRRIEHAVERTGARRLAMDSIGALFGQYSDSRTIRREILRIVRALHRLGVTSVVTAERAEEYGGIARYEVEEFVTDNVVILRNTLKDRIRRRTVEILKFRGATHHRGEHPFSIMKDQGVVVIPLSSIELKQPASDERHSTGVADLDAMCGGGFFEDSAVLVSGATGTGKTLLSTHFLEAEPEERALLFAFEEGEEQILRNAANWGIDLAGRVERGLLRIVCRYPESADLEDHLVTIKQQVETFQPERIVIDSLSSLERVATRKSFREFAIALISYLKETGTLVLFTTTTPTFASDRQSVLVSHISTIADVILLLRHVELYGEIQRGIAVLKMRGSQHDRRIRQLVVDAQGLHIGEPIPNVAGVISGDLSYIMDDTTGFTPMNTPGSRDDSA